MQYCMSCCYIEFISVVKHQYLKVFFFLKKWQGKSKAEEFFLNIFTVKLIELDFVFTGPSENNIFTLFFTIKSLNIILEFCPVVRWSPINCFKNIR